MKRSGNPALAFIGVGIAFIAIGAAGRQAFFYIGLAFLLAGLIALVRRRRGNNAAPRNS